MIPPVKQWIANPNVNLNDGFGMAAELQDGSAVVGFSVCHLKNQQTGVNQLLNKTMDLLEKEGKITSDERSNFSTALKTEVDGSALINQLFIDAAIYTTDRMNKIGDSDIDFTYQFNPSAVQGFEPTFTNEVSGVSALNAQKGATMASAAAGTTERTYTSPIGSSAARSSAPSIPSDAFHIGESGDVQDNWRSYIKYQNDNQPEASQIRKDLNDGLGLDGVASILDHYNASEDENEQYAVIGNTVLNEPQAKKAAKIIQEVFSNQA